VNSNDISPNFENYNGINPKNLLLDTTSLY